MLRPENRSTTVTRAGIIPKLVHSALCGLLLFSTAALSQVTPEEHNKIEAAIPPKATSVPAKKRRLLVFSLHVRDGQIQKGHESSPCGNLAIELMGDKTGAYETVVSNDIQLFRPENLKQFDAICFNNTAGVLFEDPELRRSLLEFVYSGKGFIGIHAAAATFVQWPVYDQWPRFGEMLGAYEDGGHPWKAHETITIKIDEPGHPLNAGFKGRSFQISDEVFQFRRPYSRDNLRILLTIDTDKTDMSEDRHFLAERQKDKDFAISWLRNYGRGRVFYSSLGHNKDIFWNASILQHFLDGIQFALGDMAAPATASGKLTPAIRTQENLGWRLGISGYTFHKYTFFESVDKTAELGLMYLTGYYKQQVGRDISKPLDCNLNNQELEVVRHELVSAGVSMPAYYIHKIPPDPQVASRVFQFCRKLGVETIICEPDQQALELLERLADQYDINLAIHNDTQDVSTIYWNPKEVLNVCKGRGKHIGACGDLGYWLRSGIDPLDALEVLGDRLMTLHIHDLNELAVHGRDVPWGTGKAQLKNFIQTLYERKIRPAMFEIEYPYSGDNLMSEIAQCKTFFDRLTVELAPR